MPVIQTNPRSDTTGLHLDVHRWHARQYYTSVPTSFTIPVAIVSVVAVFALALGIGRCLMRAQGSTHVAPRTVVRAPPGSQLGPVTADILVGMHNQTGAQDSTYVAPRAIVQAPPGSGLGPVTAEISAGLQSQGGAVTCDLASSSAPALDGEHSRTVVIHRDAGRAPEEIELPPPYSSIPLA